MEDTEAKAAKEAAKAARTARRAASRAKAEAEAAAKAKAAEEEAKKKAKMEAIDPHDARATLTLAQFVIAMGLLAHTLCQSCGLGALPLPQKLAYLLSEHASAGMEATHHVLDELGHEIRCWSPMVGLLAAHAPVLRRCWNYWNTSHGLRDWRKAPGRPSSVAVEKMKEVWHLDEEGLCAQLLSKEDRFNYNELLVMLQDTEMLGPECTSREAAALFHRCTGNMPSLAHLHPANMRDELSFDELVELLVRMALKHRGRKMLVGSADLARTALLQLVHEFLLDYYVATDRFYNGNLTRNARQIELTPEVALHLHPQGRALQHGGANLRKAKRASIAGCPKVVFVPPSEPSPPPPLPPPPPKPALRKTTTAIPRAAHAAAKVGT